MPSHAETQPFPYTTKQLYDLVADVESYPEFLPWCRAARVLDREQGYFTAELIISFKGITENYISKVVTTPPVSDNAECRIDVGLVSGPFQHLTNHWEFVPDGDGCKIDFSLDFAFKTKLLDKLIGSLFTKATHKMVTAFSKRAHALYENKD